MSTSTTEEHGRPAAHVLVLAVLGAPGAWAAHLGVSYLIVPESCRAGTPGWLHLVTALAVVAAAACTATAWRVLHGADGDRPLRLLGGLGLVVGLLFTAAVLVQGLLVLLVDPCL